MEAERLRPKFRLSDRTSGIRIVSHGLGYCSSKIHIQNYAPDGLSDIGGFLVAAKSDSGHGHWGVDLMSGPD